MSVTVYISDTTPGANVYYTTDGSTPTYPITGTTQLYTGPIVITTTTTLKAIAARDGYQNSAVASATYTIATSESWTSAGSYTFTVPAGVTSITLQATGPGGNGGAGA